MKKELAYLLLLITISFVSCKKEKDTEKETTGTVQLGFGQTQLKSITANETPAAIVITIADSKGKVVVESKKVGLINMNGSYLSDPLSLTTGSYSISKFIVLNSSDSAILATPLKDSKLAYLVKAPLPIAFIISKDNVTKVVPEVLSVKSAKFEDFGYDSFSFDIVHTFDFLATAMVYNEAIKNWKLTSANITIKAADNTIAYSDTLAAITNQITLRDNSNSFSVTVSKDGYENYTASFTADELKLYFKSSDNGPLIIKLLSESNTVTDIDGNVYHTVKIGTQVWMVENLKVTKFNDGKAIPNITDLSEWAATTTGAYCAFNNGIMDSIIFGHKIDAPTYGLLYNWAACTVNICPKGWHIPSRDEWEVLMNYLGNTASEALREAGTSHWKAPNAGATNSSGFTALPGGMRFPSGVYNGFGGSWGAEFWTSSQLDINKAYCFSINLLNGSPNLYNSIAKNFGLSIRCIKD